ncbi:MAG: pathogenicity locus [Acidobacteria bacterium]|nr:pathogenicity locus [Acidobacteriota bacterium]
MGRGPADKDAVAIRELKQIPGIGNSIAQDLVEMDIRHVSDLVGKNPEALYTRHCVMKGMKVDRCLLYVFRCAVYFAETPEPEPEKLNWWKWKD